MFFDFNVQECIPLQLRTQLVSQLYKLGYEGIAWNHQIEKVSEKNMTVDLSDFISSKGLKLNSSQKKFAQLQRATIRLEEPSQVQMLNTNNGNLSKFDIIAVRPTTEKLFIACCKDLDVDIISLDMGQRIEYPLRHTTIKLAVDRGIHFEITLSDCLKDSGCRRYLIYNAMNLVRVTRGKNIIISSAAEKLMDIRSPYDIANLGTLFGLNFDIAKNCLSSNCHSILLHGATRKAHQGVFQLVKTNEIIPKQKEVIGALKHLSVESGQATKNKGKGKRKRQ